MNLDNSKCPHNVQGKDKINCIKNLAQGVKYCEPNPIPKVVQIRMADKIGVPHKEFVSLFKFFSHG